MFVSKQQNDNMIKKTITTNKCQFYLYFFHSVALKKKKESKQI